LPDLLSILVAGVIDFPDKSVTDAGVKAPILAGLCFTTVF